jgi:hypothetical protein
MENVKHPELYPEPVEGFGLAEYAHFNTFSVLGRSNILQRILFTLYLD